MTGKNTYCQAEDRLGTFVVANLEFVHQETWITTGNLLSSTDR